jgi:hypothetical protein
MNFDRKQRIRFAVIAEDEIAYIRERYPRVFLLVPKVRRAVSGWVRETTFTYRSDCRGIYDPETNEIYLNTRGMRRHYYTFEDRVGVLAHEFAHRLQDQNDGLAWLLDIRDKPWPWPGGLTTKSIEIERAADDVGRSVLRSLKRFRAIHRRRRQ